MNKKQKLYGSREKPDLILLDVMMQPMDGWVTLKTIKADKKLSSIPVSMMTVIPPTPDIIESELIMIFENYITKPFIKTELLNKLHEAFEQRDEIKRNYE
ncbi:MAG: response regulator [Candidatus Syntrophoarchaeum sp.]|nr:response regulator [Candidatus Syntrophoarchaeum sp.]